MIDHTNQTVKPIVRTIIIQYFILFIVIWLNYSIGNDILYITTITNAIKRVGSTSSERGLSGIGSGPFIRSRTVYDFIL